MLFKPNFVFFGEKDFQQILIVQKIIDKNFYKTNLVRCETIRNKNGLALSSRNILLNKKDYENSSVIYNMLVFTKRNLMKIPYQKIKAYIESEINKVENFKVEYFEIRDEKTLFELKKNSINKGLRAFICVKVNSVRLIDNYLLN
jgi:pantoate--beta-alanine ligase